MFNLHHSEDVYMPRKKKDGVGDTIWMLDVSSSMHDLEVSAALTENHRMRQSGDIQMRRQVLIQYTSEVVSVEFFEPDEDITFERHGSGGTDVVSAFREANGLKQKGLIDPVCWIVMSDMYDDWPPEPEEPVIFISTTPLMELSGWRLPPYGVTAELYIPELHDASNPY